MPLSFEKISALKSVMEPFRDSLYNGNILVAQQQLNQIAAPNAKVHLSHPFNTLKSIDAFFLQALNPLSSAFPDLERRDTIVLAGESHSGNHWVACCGYYTGTFSKPFLDIVPTGHQASLRFHEFYKIEEGSVVEVQALWDLPELMIQANAWPMAPTLGREWHVPGPATQDGLSIQLQHQHKSADSFELVVDMLTGLGEFATGGVKAMQLEKYWHPSFSWYGPSGIGTARGVQGFRDWHQIPFLNALPNRVSSVQENDLLSEGDYVAFTGWPGMQATVSGDGWLGIAPANQAITLRSLDFWRCENGLIRENWVLVDLLHVFDQVGIDVLARMKEFNKARSYTV